ncbi:MAG: ABC transporter permease [Synergistaceae bacterium]|jgi:simple sugar transport system permease protein|nr:ABC transporter permease [Synergistaceae bacterium]
MAETSGKTSYTDKIRQSYGSLFRDEPYVRSLVLLFVISFAVLSFLKPSIFLTRSYLVNILYLFPEYGILALGMMLAMISGGIDLSVVATANMAGILCSMFLVHVVPAEANVAWGTAMLFAAFLMAMLIGASCGLLCGILISKIGIPPILATLGAGDLILGGAVALTRGSSISNLPPILSSVGSHIIAGLIPVPLVVFAVCATIVNFCLRRRAFGMRLFMLGANPRASEFSGIDNDAIICRTYAFSGIMAGISGLLMCARFNSARADFGASYTMQAILICILGGVNPNGGFGSVRGVTLSILILQILSSGFNMFPRISNFYRDLIWGLVLILVIIYNMTRNKRRALSAKNVKIQRLSS